MDGLTLAYYEAQFRVAYLERRGESFQDFFSTLMEKRYPADFQRVRPWGRAGDRKNDGYLRSQRKLFQCYAPNDMDAEKCISKIDEDFNGALPHWKEFFDVWVFVHNSAAGLGPDVTKKLLTLDAANAPLRTTSWGFEELRLEVRQLAESHLASLLGHAPSQQTVVSLGMADLQPILEQIARLQPVGDPDLRAVPSTKLARNLLSDAVAHQLRIGMMKADLVRRYFRAQSAQTRQDEIAESFRAKYAELRNQGLAADDVFHALQKFALGDALPSPVRLSAALAVLAFFFEECDIFERPLDETAVTVTEAVS